MLKQKNNLLSSTYYVQGMHCASCEILLEKRIIKEPTVESVDVSLAKGIVTIEYLANAKITPEYLNKIFKEDNYHFSSTPLKNTSKNGQCPVENKEPSDPYAALLIAAAFIVGYIVLSKTGLASLISVNAQTSLPVFFLFGLLAGVSSCAALVGGIVLSLSKQWTASYGHKFEPHYLFNIGRVLGYAGFGALLGTVGNYFQLSPVFSAILVIVVSLVMVLLGLQMVGVKALQNFQIRLPKSITGKVADESNFQGRFGPVLMGALTFFLPCGFTITAQALALASGNPLQGALIMGLFALGTVPGLLAIGLSSVKLFGNPQKAKTFSLVAGMLVLFFAAFNINAQFAVLGFTGLDVLSNHNDLTTNTSAPIVNGKQVLTMTASGNGYNPNQFTVKVGAPVQWNITADSTVGCASTLVAQGLFPERLNLTPGEVVTKEFTPTKPGTYRFSCSMGMYTGTIVVVDSTGNVGSAAPLVDSGSKGCGCGSASTTAGGSCH